MTQKNKMFSDKSSVLYFDTCDEQLFVTCNNTLFDVFVLISGSL